MLRMILGIATGYLLFAASAVALFQLSGVDPHAPSSTGFRVLAVLYGAAFSVASGYLATAIARREQLRFAMVVASMVALAGIISLLARPGDGPMWTQVASIVLFAPLVVAGGHLRIQRRRARLRDARPTA